MVAGAPTIGGLKRLSLYMAGQLKSAVAITGGSISGVTLTSTSATLTTPAITGGTITGATLSANINSDVKRTSASVTKNASTVYANVTGLSTTVVPGTYQFKCRLPSTVASGTGGIKYAFNYTTAVLSGIEATAKGFTASAVAVQHTTTTTTQADLFTQAAVVIWVDIDGTMVVTTGGAVDLQVAQNTSDASNTVALLGGTMQFIRIA